MDEELKPWRCDGNKQHILGQVRRNGNGVRQLLLYRHPVDLDAGDLVEVDVMAVIEGFVMDVTCEICGCARTWVPGQEAMDRLIGQVLKARASFNRE